MQIFSVVLSLPPSSHESFINSRREAKKRGNRGTKRKREAKEGKKSAHRQARSLKTVLFCPYTLQRSTLGPWRRLVIGRVGCSTWSRPTKVSPSSFHHPRRPWRVTKRGRNSPEIPNPSPPLWSSRPDLMTHMAPKLTHEGCHKTYTQHNLFLLPYSPSILTILLSLSLFLR